MSCENSITKEKSVDKKEEAKEIATKIVCLIEDHLSFLPDDGTAFRNRYYLSSYYHIMKDVAIRLGKKMKNNISHAELKKIGIDILDKIEWQDINKSPEFSIVNLQESCNQNAQQIVILSFETARATLLAQGNPDNEETSKKAIEIVRKKFPNVPIQFTQDNKEDAVTQEVTS